jgi:hypothetical protein
MEQSDEVGRYSLLNLGGEASQVKTIFDTKKIENAFILK